MIHPFLWSEWNLCINTIVTLVNKYWKQRQFLARYWTWRNLRPETDLDPTFKKIRIRKPVKKCVEGAEYPGNATKTSLFQNRGGHRNLSRYSIKCTLSLSIHLSLSLFRSLSLSLSLYSSLFYYLFLFFQGRTLILNWTCQSLSHSFNHGLTHFYVCCLYWTI